MEQILIRNLPTGTKAALRARAKLHHRSVEAEVRTILTDSIASKPASIVDLVAMDEGVEIVFEPERLGVSARTAAL